MNLKNNKQRGIRHSNRLLKGRIKIKTKVITGYKAKGIEGDLWNHLALKNENSFLVGGKDKGIKLVDNGRLLFVGKVSNKMFSSLGDIFYSRRLNCYFIHADYNLYRKEIDRNPPYLFLHLDERENNFKSLVYSEKKEKLVILRINKNFLVLSPGRKKIEFTLARKKILGEAMDSSFFGSRDDELVGITFDRVAFVYDLFSPRQSREIVSTLHLKTLDETEDCGSSIAGSHNGDYFCVALGKFTHPWSISRVVLIRFDSSSRRLEVVATLNLFEKNIGNLLSLGCSGQIGRYLTFFGLSRLKKGVVLLFGYDNENGEFREVGNSCVSHRERYPSKIEKLGKSFYYTGYFGKVVRLRVTL